MSVSLILIPAALAAVTAISAAGGIGALSQVGGDREVERDIEVDRAEAEGPRPVSVRTRMKDPDLLGDAHHEDRATATHQSCECG